MAIDPIQFRNALGSFATGVCVITANPEGELPFGMTVNSFASVSLDPPLVLWSLQNNSECYAAFEKSTTFGVSVLAQDQQALSNKYAKKGDHALASEDYRLGSSGLPIINGALVSFECEVWNRYPGGDHVILIGKVLEMTQGEDKAPLLFHKGKYQTIA